MSHHDEPVSAMIAKASPPVAVVTAHLAQITIPEIINYATLLYLCLMISHKAWRMWREYRTGKVVPDGD